MMSSSSNELEPLDLETLVRTVAFQMLLERGQAVSPSLLAEAIGVRADKLVALVGQLDLAGRIRRGPTGMVVGSCGLSVIPDRHAIELDGRTFWTWCAYDILGIFGALGASGRASSPSPPGGLRIELRFVVGRPQGSDAVLFRPDSELMECCENVYEEWCPNSNLFASRELAETWSGERHVSGRILSLEGASDLATEEWMPMTADLRTKAKQVDEKENHQA